MKTIRKITAFVLCAVMLCSVIAVSSIQNKAQATTNGITQAQAVEWVNAKVNEHWCQDFDGYLGCQCVDLVTCYYEYLTGSYALSYAYAYETNILPSGWQRLYGVVPQPGDVLVWSRAAVSNSTGHVGICITADSTNTYYAETNGRYGTACYANTRSTSGITCVIRPDFGVNDALVTPVPSTGSSTGSSSSGSSAGATAGTTTVDLSQIINVDTINAMLKLAKSMIPVLIQIINYVRFFIARLY